MLTTDSSTEQDNIISSLSSMDDNINHQDNSEEQLDVSEEDISEIEEYLAKEDIDPTNLRNKANKLIQLIKVKERDLLLAAQIGQSLLDANVSMQNQLKIISENQKNNLQGFRDDDNLEASQQINADDYYGSYGSQSPMTMNPRTNSTVCFDDPIPNSNSMRNSGKKPISRSDSYDIDSYTDNLEETNYRLQNQVEKLEESLKQNEQQNSKRIVLLENLLDQLQNELSELQTMNRDLENEKRILLEEKESSKRINEMSEKDTEKMIAQLFDNKNKLANTVNKLEIKKKVLENELMDAMNGGSMLQNEIAKWKQEAEDCNKYKELYEQELQRVSVLEASLNSYHDDIKLIKAAQMGLKSRSSNFDVDEDFDYHNSHDKLNEKLKLSEEINDSQGESSRSRKIRRRRIIRHSNEGEEANIEEEIEEREIIGYRNSRNGHHHRHHLRHIQPLSYENDICTVTPSYDNDENVVVLQGRINRIDERDEDTDGANSREIVLRDKPCNKCGKIRLNRFSHQKNTHRSHSRVMRARAKRTAISRKRYSALVPLKSTGEEDEETNSLIKLRDRSGFMNIYNTCKEAIEKLDYSKTELSRSQSAWKFLQFWFAMLCIFIGCIVVSYRRVFNGNTSSRPVKKTISK
ncbi:hypothetical protein BCR36DRAFT_581113 [Piromyces finnis]|uniref:Uncharacterized protein n=1 Tax=Piromyces finnis TaxID=1754191 RepID=A0A1Y1VIN4_9FUNG|nr:hypothetical protein BCR36DRAFT_581113 [Piromyces finnis]|eukprot:ORX55952.1 hypothetical protein BCR36DRAFT_581113 [Piromyces finnis]